MFTNRYLKPFDLGKDVTSRRLVKRKDDGEWDLGELEY